MGGWYAPKHGAKAGARDLVGAYVFKGPRPGQELTVVFGPGEMVGLVLSIVNQRNDEHLLHTNRKGNKRQHDLLGVPRQNVVWLADCM